jgi:hypothetical protein
MSAAEQAILVGIGLFWASVFMYDLRNRTDFPHVRVELDLMHWASHLLFWGGLIVSSMESQA